MAIDIGTVSGVLLRWYRCASRRSFGGRGALWEHHGIDQHGAVVSMLVARNLVWRDLDGAFPNIYGVHIGIM